MELVRVKVEPQELIELGDSDDNEDNERMMMFDIDEDTNRTMIEILRRRRNRRSASVSSQPRFGPLADSLIVSPTHFGTPTRLTICEDDESELVQTKADLAHAVLNAVQLARLGKYLNFEQLHELVASNAFVRLLSGAQKKIDQIVGILCCDKPYDCDLLDIKYNMRFQTLWSGVCRLTQIAAQPAEEMAEKEFDRWKQEMQKRRLKLPTLEDIAEKSAEISEALAKIEHQHSSDSDFPALRVRPEEQEEDIMPAGCFSETDDETEGQQKSNFSSPVENARPFARAVAGPSRSDTSPRPTPIASSTTHPVDDPVKTVEDVKAALLTRERLIALYTNNSFDQFGRAVTCCFVRVNTDQAGYKLDQLDMVSETATELYTLKRDRKCRVILHLTLHGRRRINAVAFTLFKGTAQADTEFNEWHALMAKKCVTLPSKRFVASKVAQLAAFSAKKEQPPPLPPANLAPKQLRRKDSSDSASSGETTTDKEQHNSENDEQEDDDDDVQLLNEEEDNHESCSKLTPDDLRPITLTTRDMIELFEHEPSLAKRHKFLNGCFVRVFDHAQPDTDTFVHRLHQIVHVQKGMFYRLRTSFVNMHLSLRGESDTVRCDNVSSKAFTEDEFDEWFQRTQEKEFPFPSKLFIAQKMECLGRSNGNSSPVSSVPLKTESEPRPAKMNRKKRTWMAFFGNRRDRVDERTDEKDEEKRNRTMPMTTPRPSSGRNFYRPTNYAQRHQHLKTHF